MPPSDDIHWADLTAYLAGEADAELRHRVEAWAADTSRRRALAELRRLWVASGHALKQSPSDPSLLEARWAELVGRLEGRGLSPPDARRKRSTRLRPVRLPERTPKAPRRPSGLRQFVRVGAIIGAFALAALLVWSLGPEPEPVVPPMQVVTTGNGQRAQVRLADGTRVHLNVASELRFTPGFTDGLRRVHLKGEAYFDVARDEIRPFIIHAADADVQVLGTSFGVRAYEEGAVEVAVAEGAVALRSRLAALADTVVLRPGDLGHIAGEEAFALRQEADLTRRLAWMEGRLVFEDAPLAEVAAGLERWYKLQVQVEVPPGTTDRLNAVFEDEPLSEILSSISATLGLRYERDRSHVRFLPAGD